MADLGEAIEKLLGDACQMTPWQREVLGYVVDDQVRRPDDVTIVKAGAWVPISTDLALDMGLITEEQARARGWTPYVPPPTPWRTRLRRRLAELRDQAALRLYRLVAGHDPEVDCDC